MVCADPNPWDGQIVCELPAGHGGLHEAWRCIRWSDRCHFDGDDCPRGTHGLGVVA
jgi:hypothetical protein